MKEILILFLIIQSVGIKAWILCAEVFSRKPNQIATCKCRMSIILQHDYYTQNAGGYCVADVSSDLQWKKIIIHQNTIE